MPAIAIYLKKSIAIYLMKSIVIYLVLMFATSEVRGWASQCHGHNTPSVDRGREARGAQRHARRAAGTSRWHFSNHTHCHAVLGPSPWAHPGRVSPRLAVPRF